MVPSKDRKEVKNVGTGKSWDANDWYGRIVQIVAVLNYCTYTIMYLLDAGMRVYISDRRMNAWPSNNITLPKRLFHIHANMLPGTDAAHATKDHVSPFSLGPISPSLPGVGFSRLSNKAVEVARTSVRKPTPTLSGAAV